MINFLKIKKIYLLFIFLLILFIAFFIFSNFTKKSEEISFKNIPNEVIKFNLIKDSEFSSFKIKSYSDYPLSDLDNNLKNLISESVFNLISKSINYNNDLKGFYISYFINQKLENFYFDTNLSLVKNNWKILSSKRINIFGSIEAENEFYKIIFNIHDNSKENIDLIFVEIYILNK